MSKALFWGVNIYAHYPEDTLRGCLNDRKNLYRSRVNELGLSPKDAVLLDDSKATETKIKEAFMDLVLGQEGAPKNLWISGSSHGTNNPDSSQVDGLQELLCCYDLEEDNGIWTGGFISAKWIGDTIAMMRPEDTLDILLDCCHAPQGHQLKALGRSYDRARWMPRTEPVAVKVQPKTIQAIQGGIPKNVALWSACQPEQTSADAHIDGQWQGACTASFLKAQKKGRCRSDIVYHTREWLKENRYSQIPHLYCWPELAFKPLSG